MAAFLSRNLDLRYLCRFRSLLQPNQNQERASHILVCDTRSVYDCHSAWHGAIKSTNLLPRAELVL